MRSIGTKVALGALFLVGARFVLRILGLLSVAVLARLLSPEDYGVMAYAVVVLGTLDVFTNLQMSMALIRRETVEESAFDTAFTLSIMRGALLSVALFLSAEAIATAVAEPRLAVVLRWLSIAPLLDGFRNSRFVLFEKELDFSKAFYVQLVSKVAATASMIAGALVWGDYRALAMGPIVEALVVTGAQYALLPRRPGLSLHNWRYFLGFGGWLTGANILSHLNYKSDVFIVGGALGTATLGQYSMGDQMSAMATQQLSQPMARALYPGLAKLQGDRARLRAAYYKGQSAMLALVLPIGVGSALVAHELVVVVVGPRWLEAIPVVQWISPVIAVGLLAAPVRSIIMVDGRTRSLFMRNLLMLCLRVPMLIAGVWFGGIMGVLYARVVASLALTLITLQLGARLLQDGVLAPFAAGWRSLVAAAAMTATVLALETFLPPPSTDFLPALNALAAKAAVGSLVYAAAHAAAWIAAGRPDGLERKIMDFATMAVQRLRRARA